MKFGRIRDLLLTLLLILSVDGCNSDKKDVNAEGANSTSNLSKDGDGTTTGTPIHKGSDKDIIPSGMTIPEENITSYIVSLSDGTIYRQGEIDEWGGIEVKIPCSITETNSPVKLHEYSRRFIIASSSTEDNESDIIATFAWEEQELNSSTKSFDANITINDSNGNNDGRYEAKKLAIGNKSGITAATFSYPRGDATINGTLSLKIIPGILDRNFYKKTNNRFEHRFIYAPVTNPVTGRTWLNNNLGAEYADVNSSYFNPLNQATTIKSYLAYGSLFQWGRKADGHELIHWTDATHGEPLYGTTTTKADDPSNSLYITSSGDWRVHSDDTLWASESTPNNVCPVGYRLPLNPSGVSDGENEWFVEMSTWDAPDANGSISSYLKLPFAGHRNKKRGQMKRVTELGQYWTGSDYGDSPYDIYFGEELNYNDYSKKSYGYSVRCIKDQTPAEKTYSILLEIANEDRNRNHKSVITAAQLHEITSNGTPALKNINDDMVNNYRRYIESDDTNFSSPATIEEVQTMIDTYNISTDALLSDISQQHQEHNSTITVEQLRVITPRLNQLQKANEKYYQSYIEGDTHFSSPTATRDEVQHMITEVNNLNLPKHAILDRSFFKKTNGVFQHRFVYLPVESNTTGRTWLNNNLGAEYANVDSSDYNPSQQATAIKDLLANGSLFQWGRKADGHELIEWSHLSGKYGPIPINSDNPDDSFFITGSDDWRVDSNDTLWASESSPNNVCPVGYRLPLNPNGANDGANEWYQETKDLTQNIGGLFHSSLKISTTGIRNGNASIKWSDGGSSNYWSGSVRSDGKALSMGSNRGVLVASDYQVKIAALPVRCIKEQTPAERSATILAEIGDEHRNHKSVITIGQLKAITPALENININYQDIYRSYIASADTTFSFSSPATRDEVQQMITQVKNLNLPRNAILDRSFFKKTNGVFEHRFVYLPVTNPHTGRTWLNNNLGADYANVDSSDYNPSQQATATNDYLAYGSLFQWGRKADGHELIKWSGTIGVGIYGTTSAKVDNPSNSLFIKITWGDSDWRVNPDDTLWASESSANNVCPVGYRLPLNPNGAEDAANEFDVESNTWTTQNSVGALGSTLVLTRPGYSDSRNNVIYGKGSSGDYWTGSVIAGGNAHYAGFYLGGVYTNVNHVKAAGYAVRCIKDQTPAERSDSILLEIANEQSNHKSIMTIGELRAITPALENINDDYENTYRTYIANAGSNFFSLPATRDEVQRMINIVNNNRIYELGSYNTAGNAKGVILSHDGTKAYIADYWNGLVMVDIRKPAHPKKHGSFKIPNNVVYGVTLSNDGTKAYIAGFENGLVIANIYDPVYPFELGSYDTAGIAYNVTLSSDNTKAYIADDLNGLVIVDISDPTNPTKLGLYVIAGYPHDITLSSDGTKAYLADDVNGLVIVDVSDPAHPTKLGSYDTAGRANGVTLSSDGTKAYIADGRNGLVIIDISNPAHPTKLGSYNTAGIAYDVTLSSDGTKAYVAAGKVGLVIVDISNSARPIKLNSYDTAGESYGVTLSRDGTKAYIADGKNGLVIIDGIK